ncbi:Vacuolar membrane-associated protein [Fulvia fulva]|nr:Vacuolar membrane-associated protein [Fulvia fulva]
MATNGEAGAPGRACTIVLHDDRVTKVDVLSGDRVLHVGEYAWLSAPAARKLCIAPAGQTTGANEISLHISLAKQFGFENRTQGKLDIIEPEDLEPSTATHVELFFREQFLSRADMWQLMGCVQDTVVYQGQIVNYLGTAVGEIQQVYISAQEVESAICSHPYTKPIFRSGSARYTLLIEVSQEMLENWSNGDLMYERLLDGFLPELFQRWDRLKVKHQVAVVLFGRRRSATAAGKRDSQQSELLSEDFYHVVVSDMTSTTWQQILRKLKAAFNDYRLPRAVSLAAESNLLEAIHLTAMDYADDQIDAHLLSTGCSIIAITAGAGLFDADHKLLKQTTDLLVGNSIGVDVVALTPKPMHPVPLFQYDNEGIKEFAVPHWVDISFWSSPHDTQDTSWTLSAYLEPVAEIALPPLLADHEEGISTDEMDQHDTDVFSDATPAIANALQPVDSQTDSDPVGSVETMKGVPIGRSPTKHSRETVSTASADSNLSSSPAMASKEPINRAKRQRLPPHPLMQSGRKISVGPKGLALSRGVASTGLASISATYAQQEKEIAAGTVSTSSETSSGLAKAIRASLRRKPSQQSVISNRLSDPSDPEENPNSRPIAIHAVQETTNGSPDNLASDVEQRIADTMVGNVLENDTSLSTTPKAGNHFPRKGPANGSLEMRSPWVTLLNPCNPRRDNMVVTSQYRKWQHVFPRAISSGAFKWQSMCTPAALPLTAEYKPSASELDIHYNKKVRRHTLANSISLKDETARILVERMIDVRLCQGFQIVALKNTGGDSTFQSKNRPVLLSLGRRYHEVQRLSDFEVQVVQYDPKKGIGSEGDGTEHYLTNYDPKMKLPTGMSVKAEVTYHSELPLRDWSDLDNYILGLTSELKEEINATFQMRLILIPVEVTKSDRDLTDQERRIEGIGRLTQSWQRQRHISVEAQQHLASMSKNKSTAIPSERDPNPLAIDYQTKDSSVIVNAHGPTLSSQLEEHELSQPLFAESEKHHSSNFDVAKLVKQIQDPPPNGVEMRDRRWLTVTHLRCFRGDQMTTWLLGAFKDLKLREDAVTMGNELMSRGIFHHVRQKHRFRDGHYFYQISSAHRTTEYPDTQGLFSKVAWKTAPSVPATPISESVKSPMMRPFTGDSSSSSSNGTPATGPLHTKQILLSQMMQYNVDPTKRSDHLQVIDLHYDRIHNPENCYHIQLEWLSASTKLVREAIARWSSLVEGYGLKLMQVPLHEACKYREHHPFDQPQPIKLAIMPPTKNIIQTPVMGPYSPLPQSIVEDPVAYHKAILRKLNFVLDTEAARSFTTELDVRYTWGPPSYEYTQFVHKSGLILAEITCAPFGDDSVNFLLLPNRLAANTISGSAKSVETGPGKNAEPVSGTTDTVETIVKEFKHFCHDEEALRQLYDEVNKRKPPVAPSPFSGAGGGFGADLDVPPMQLPPHLSHRGGGGHRSLLSGLE